MIDFFKRNKVFIIVTLATVILLVGGVLLMTREKPTSTINSTILVPEGSIGTSGFVDGKYLPASSSATVTLVEFGDYECPACALYSPFIKQLLTDFAGKVTFVFRNYPLSYHTNALSSSYAVEAAGLQGKYWEMHEKMYATQNDWSVLDNATDVFLGYAKEMELDIEKFKSDMASDIVINKVKKDTNDGNTVRLTETPTYYLNGKKISISGSYDQLKNLVQEELNKQ